MTAAEIKEMFSQLCKEPVRIINMDDPEVIASIEECKKQQEAILKLKKIDVNRLRNTIITI